jgi:hypothetical protein
MKRSALPGVAVGALLLVAAPAARADLGNFDLSGKIYTKYMYQNDNTQGCLSMSNPFWVDNIGGHNGACTEFELQIKGKISPKVTAGVRLQSRWGMLWQDWWENGDLKPGVYDTSGESLGMNHATYIKLRGAWVRMAPPIPSVKWVTIGSTDYSMWNEWTIGKARYIDRDNGNGIFVEGEAIKGGLLSYTTGAMALPKLWAGPGWQTGLAGNDPKASLYGTDWAFAAKLESRPIEDLRLKLIGSLIQDWEADKYSPMLTGDASAARGADHSVGMASRFRGVNVTLDGNWTPSRWDFLAVSWLLAYSSNNVNPEYATNAVTNGQGFSPVVFKTDAAGHPIASNDAAAKALVELMDPLGIGLSLKAEGFYIGPEYNAIMGSRREADVLLTDGIITGGFTRGGQLPTLNIANEFQDWDEPWYESCIGWMGGTALLEYVSGSLKLTGEGTLIAYNTDAQGRDTKKQYPDFLYTNGFTDTTAFTAASDYANVYARGKDPRSVYAEFQDRLTYLAVLNAQYALPWWSGAAVVGKVKYVHDFDGRNKAYTSLVEGVRVSTPTADDYLGQMYMGYLALSLQPTNELKTTIGYEFSYWTEKNRVGSQTGGYFDDNTRRHTARAGLTYLFGGANLSYNIEYFHKDLLRDQTANYNQAWNVWRSKATFEVAW